ncbi:MAG: TIGR01621 family pseudouridine synthase [Haemophilus sp.]|uniref:TIGR01621 family pseudouridine synthase n=1 Tax=Haemophilus parainfluenzae TaxID=729 RepID=A0AB37IEG1_HAEPA|nr:TIGR01621 family pseudouridine synthase [Haemophilus parainfluenzae]MBF1239804.1 TIGR01621 family pseudouridine synthase [Haemophilus sp.]RDE90339.1 TIGR01621 family pseudouridine synthase [Haemophilus parainfluenzae]
MKLDIIYQTDDFIIIYKPCGISVHKDQSEIGLTTLLAEQFSVPQVWLVHRLDKVTSGLLILALNAESAAEFFRLFSEHHIQKTYLALSNQKPKKKQGLIVGDMQKARNGAWKLCQSKENPAITRFESVSCEPNLRLFILKPQTGKTHQLRVAMKSLGSPILGDALYGKKTEKIDRTYLHAARLQFEFKGQAFDVFIPPKEGEWWHREGVMSQIQKIGSASAEPKI